jgi:LacI family transcriptional regulator
MARIRDVAQLAQVSEATVSRVLRGDVTFSATEATRRRIFDAAAELGYPIRPPRPGKAKPPAMERSFTAGLLLTISQEDEVNDPYYLSIRLGIEKQCQVLGIDLKTTLRLGRSLAPTDFAGLDGLIVVGSIEPKSLHPAYFTSDNLVFVNNMLHHDPDFDAVLSDLAAATEECVDRLYSLGHRRIGYIGGSEMIYNLATRENVMTPDVRCLTYERRMRELGLLDPNLIFIGSWTAADGQRLAQEALARGPLPTAFLVGSDPMSLGVVHAFREARIRVPEDVSIISFDDIEAAAFMNPPLSTVQMFTEEIGRQAVRTLHDRLLGRDIVINVVVPARLVVRQSYSQPRKEGSD